MEGSPLTMLILGGGRLTLNLERIRKDYGRIASDNADSGGGQSTLNLERIRKDYGRITSDNADPGGGVDRHSTWKGSVKTMEGSPLTMLILGGRSTLNLERIHEDYGRIASDNADPGEGRSTLNLEGSVKTMKGSPLTMLILGGGGQSTLNLERIREDYGRIASDNADSWGGRSTLNLERICEDYGRIASDNADPGGVDRHSTWKGSAKTMEGSPLTMLILGVDRHSTWKGYAKTMEGSPLTMLIRGGVDRHSTWKGSAKTMEGSPLTMLILGGVQSTLKLERICKDLGRIASTWKGFAMTLEGSPQLGKDPQ